MVGMSTFDESLHPRGQATNSGQFKSKENSAPVGSLASVLDLVTPADVRNADYTIELLRDHIVREGVTGFHEAAADDEGNAVVEWEEHSPYGDYSWRYRARIDPNGEIVGSEEQSGSGTWHNSDPYGDKLYALRMQVNRVRLAHAGVFLDGQPNDGGAYGLKAVGGRAGAGATDATYISAEIRKHIKAAKEWGALPTAYEYRPHTHKYAGGQSIDIDVEGMPDSVHYVERQDGFPHGQSGHAKEIDEVLSLIGGQWNVVDRDYMGDYRSQRYYCFVHIDDERMAKFRAEQRAIAARKRAEKKARAAA